MIGNAARSPLHVRFELYAWTDAGGFVAVDPREQLESWNVEPTTLRALATGTNDNEAA